MRLLTKKAMESQTVKWFIGLFDMDKKDWLEDMRQNLSVVATLIAAVTFQAALNPPGGVVQTSTEASETLYGCNNATNVRDNTTGKYKLCTGESVLAIVFKYDYLIFLILNSLSFIGSLSAALFLVSGIPLRHRPLMWFLSLVMSASLAFLAMTYLYGVLLLMPSNIYSEARKIIIKIIWIWNGLLMLAILLNTIYFVVWCRKLIKSLRNKGDTSENQELTKLEVK